MILLNDGTEVYFQNQQVIEVHREVTRTFSSWFGLLKTKETFLEVEEGVHVYDFQSDGKENFFYFQFYHEYISISELPDDTLFIATDKFVKRIGKKQRKKKTFLAKLIEALFPNPKPEVIGI